jgi:hypothetical protein
MADDFILTLDSDSEPETSRPSTSKRGKQTTTTASKSKSTSTPTAKKPEDVEEFALDDEFALDFSGLDGARTALRETLGDGVDFWEQDDQVQGGKLVRSTSLMIWYYSILDLA